VVNLEFDIVGKYITKMLKQYLESGQIDRLLK